MGSFNLPVKNSGGNPPEVEAGLALVRFDDIKQRLVEQFITESDNYGKPDDGQRLDILFTLLDEDRAVVFDERDDGSIVPVELRQAKACKPGATGQNSNFYEYLSGLLTVEEMALWEVATADKPFDGSAMQGRIYNVKIGHNKKGWPQVDTIIGIAKEKKTK